MCVHLHNVLIMEWLIHILILKSTVHRSLQGWPRVNTFFHCRSCCKFPVIPHQSPHVLHIDFAVDCAANSLWNYLYTMKGWNLWWKSKVLLQQNEHSTDLKIRSVLLFLCRISPLYVNRVFKTPFTCIILLPIHIANPQWIHRIWTHPNKSHKKLFTISLLIPTWFQN